MNVVTAVRRPVGIAARTNQRRRRRLPIRSARAPAVPAAASGSWLDGTSAGRAAGRTTTRTRTAAAATMAMKTPIPAIQSARWAVRPSAGSKRSG